MNPNRQNPFLGILMLDTQFPRIIGDVGNIESYSYPARTLVVEGADSVDIVKDGLPSNELIEKFCIAAQQLETDGAKAIISSCGFLISVQEIISNAVNIPVMVSSLSLYPQIIKENSAAKVVIITASQKSLGEGALKSAGIMNKESVAVIGMEDCSAFSNAFLMKKEDQTLRLEKDSIEKAVVEKSIQLLEHNPDITTILLECGNLPPYADAIKQATSKPVFHILDAADQMML